MGSRPSCFVRQFGRSRTNSTAWQRASCRSVSRGSTRFAPSSLSLGKPTTISQYEARHPRRTEARPLDLSETLLYVGSSFPCARARTARCARARTGRCARARSAPRSWVATAARHLQGRRGRAQIGIDGHQRLASYSSGASHKYPLIQVIRQKPTTMAISLAMPR